MKRLLIGFCFLALTAVSNLAIAGDDVIDLGCLDCDSDEIADKELFDILKSFETPDCTGVAISSASDDSAWVVIDGKVYFCGIGTIKNNRTRNMCIRVPFREDKD